MQSKHIAEEWLGSCLYFQNADYCLHPAGLVFFSEHSRDVSPKVAPWRCDPWPSVGDPTRCGVCAGTVARGSSVSRGEALSPQTATESMARGVLSAPLSIILPPRLSLSTRSLALFLSHSFIYTVSFFSAVSHFARFSVKLCFPSLFLYSSAFPPLSLRCPLFHSDHRLSSVFSHLLRPPQFRTRSPSQRAVFPVLPSFIRFTSTFLLFTQALNMKVFLSRPLDWQSRRAGRITRQLISASERKNTSRGLSHLRSRI